jgi:hypothetical protein
VRPLRAEGVIFDGGRRAPSNGIEAIHPRIIRRGRLVARLPRGATVHSSAIIGTGRARNFLRLPRGCGWGPKFVYRARTEYASQICSEISKVCLIHAARQLFLGATCSAIINQCPCATVKSHAVLIPNSSIPLNSSHCLRRVDRWVYGLAAAFPLANFVRNFEGVLYPLRRRFQERKYLPRVRVADHWWLHVATACGCRRITIDCYVCSSACGEAQLFRHVRLLSRSRWRLYGGA